jgi:hypothetical protein
MAISCKFGIRTYLRNYFYYRWKEKQFLEVPLSKTYHFNFEEKSFDLLFITIAYNNTELLEHQVRLIKKFVKDNYKHIVLDNSIIGERRSIIENICRTQQVAYVALPKNCYQFNSKSHGLALNWACKNLLPILQVEYVGLLDHDIYPISEQTLMPLLRKQIALGLKDEDTPNVWYLWPGFSFFRRQILQDKNINFKPGQVSGAGVDTGGLLYKSLYSQMNSNKLIFPAVEQKILRKDDTGQIEKIDLIRLPENILWLHSRNGSYWKKVPPKEPQIRALLNKY